VYLRSGDREVQRIQKAEGIAFTNGQTCKGVEYSFGDKAMNMALVTVEGRYPESGYVMNDVCNEMGYVVSGTGKLCRDDGSELAVVVGDAVFIAPGEKYYWEGEALSMVMPCAPAFYPEQHRHIA
jgi:mannose-6-phosphate isomerase-like protein (cupin superfamily)